MPDLVRVGVPLLLFQHDFRGLDHSRHRITHLEIHFVRHSRRIAPSFYNRPAPNAQLSSERVGGLSLLAINDVRQAPALAFACCRRDGRADERRSRTESARASPRLSDRAIWRALAILYDSKRFINTLSADSPLPGLGMENPPAVVASRREVPHASLHRPTDSIPGYFAFGQLGYSHRGKRTQADSAAQRDP
jgi:hypothetical protein